MLVIRHRLLGLLVVAAVTTAAGCGYQFQGSGSRLPPDVKTLGILPVVNETTEPGLDLRFTEELRSRFERYGVVTVLDDPQEADATLSVRIKDVDTRTRSVESNRDVAVDLDLIMVLSADLKKRSGQILWRSSDFRVSEPFAGTSDVIVQSSAGFIGGDIGSANLGSLGTQEVSRGQREQALANILEEAARELYEDAVAADF